MDLILTATGRRCDLSLHPVSSKTVERIQALGRKFYAKKYIQWWRSGNSSTCGMKFDDECEFKATLDGQPVTFDTSAIAKSAVLLRRRHYLESKARYLALLGYDDEYCNMTWTWKNVTSFDPARLDFFVHRWDRILGEEDFLIIDDVRYDGAFADEQDWGGSCGFTLVDPRVIDLNEVRRELGIDIPEGEPEKDRASRSPASSAKRMAVPRELAAKCDISEKELILPVEQPNAVGMYSCTKCKNSIRVELRMEGGSVAQAGGVSTGCEYGKECLVALTGLVTGMAIQDCYALSYEDLRARLPRVLPKLNCDAATISALKRALRNWEQRGVA